VLTWSNKFRNFQTIIGLFKDLWNSLKICKKL
jgi:hypothetical protein